MKVLKSILDKTILLDEPSGSETSNTSAEEEVTDESEQEDNENKGMEEGSEKKEAQQEEVTDVEGNDKENASSEIEVTPPRDKGDDNVAMESSETTTSPVDDNESPRGEDDDDPFGNTGEDDLFIKPEKPINIEERLQSSSEEDDTEYAEANADVEKAEGLSCCRC